MPLMNPKPVANAQHVVDRLALRLPQLQHLARLDQPIASLGLDSIDWVELLCVIESEFNVTIRDEDLVGAATVETLAELICRRCEERQVQS